MEKQLEQVENILSQLSVREKALLLTGESMFRQRGLPEKGLPSLYYLDGGTGAAYHQMFIDWFYRQNITGESGADELINDASGLADRMLRLMDLVLGRRAINDPAEQTEVEAAREAMKEYTPGGELPGCFPPGSLLGCCWDGETVYEMGCAVGKEADYFGVDVLLGTPNVNIQRDPLGGRFFEGYSEDPYLTAALAPQLVRGVQSNGIAANVKHFAANNQETDRRTVNEHIPIRALYEIYFPGFRACIQDGDCKTVMSAYNAINGQYCAMNRWLLTEVLRERWGFTGMVVSDWCAVYDQVAAMKAGNDVDMPGPRSVDAVVTAVEHSMLDEAALDTALMRVWTTALSLPCCTEGHRQAAIDREGSRSAAYRCVKEGMVLLKNENGTLPFAKGNTVAIFGEKSKKLLECGGGSANIITGQTSNLFDALTARMGADHIQDGFADEKTDILLITVGTGGQEGFDRKDLEMDVADTTALLQAIERKKQLGKRLVAVLNTAGPVDLLPYLEELDAVLYLLIPGMEGGNACADALLGVINPSGKLAHTYPKRYRDCPSSTSFPGWNNESWYSEGIFVGYRWYDYRRIDPLYPFGFGLSYTTFTLSNAALSASVLSKDADETAVLSVDITNTGAVAGKEVVQVYVGQDAPTLPKPVRELRYFKKLALQPGETKTVQFTLKADDWRAFDERVDDWVVEPDVYHIYAGTSSRDLPICLDIRVDGVDAYGMNEKTTLGVLAAAEGALDTLSRFCPAERGITREVIEATILYQPSGTLEEYWKNRVEPELPGSAGEKEEIYRRMLAAISRFK